MPLLLEAPDSRVDLLYGELGPTPKQQLFRDCPASFRLYGGAVGGGKTVALCAEALRLSLAYPGNRGFLCRHETKALRLTTLVTLLKLIGELEHLTDSKLLSNHHKTEQIIYLTNGSVILYGALGEAQDFERIKSLEIGWFAIDEASEAVYENYCMLLSRLRWRLPKGKYPPYIGLLASNPEPGWVKDVFVTPWKMHQELPNHAFIQALPSDNPHLPPTYVDNLRINNPESWVKRYIEGSWDALEGQVWPMFDFNTHVIEPFDLPESWTKFRSIDHGQDHPTCCLWCAVDTDDNLFVCREYYMPGIVSNHCKAINTLSTEPSYDYTLLPPECWGKDREKNGREWSIYDEYTDHAIYPIRANNTVLAGLNRVGEYLTPREKHVHPRLGTLNAPRLYIFKTCHNLILEIPDYTWKTYRGEEAGKERPRKVKDDAVDTLRYAVMSRPSTEAVQSRIPFNSFLETRKRLIHAQGLAGRLRTSKHDAFDKLNRRLISV